MINAGLNCVRLNQSETPIVAGWFPWKYTLRRFMKGTFVETFTRLTPVVHGGGGGENR